MKYHIVSIGISKHSDPQANLQFAHKDAADFYTLMTQNLPDVGYKKLLIDNEATLSAIQTSLGTALQNEVSQNDCFIFYYSGHGALAPKGDGFSHFLVPFDVTQDISNSCIPVEYIKDVFDKLKCNTKLFFVDSCFSGAVNSKSYGPSYKDISKVKTLTAELAGQGSLIFTACKDDEKSIEEPSLYNGLFTSFLLSTLESKNKAQFSVVDIFTPVTEEVVKYASDKYCFKQTPTLSGELKGVVYLPMFRKPLSIKPELILPEQPEEISKIAPLIPEIQISSEEENDFIEKTKALVVGKDIVKFEQFISDLIEQVSVNWEKIFSSYSGDINYVPEAVGKIEADSYQLFVLSAIVGKYGTKEQVDVFAESCVSLLRLTKDKSGLIALIAVPEVVVLLAEYLLTMMAVVNNDYSRLKEFLYYRVFGWSFDSEPPLIVDFYQIHYTRALTGYADKVADYIRSSLKNFDWIKEIEPKIKDTETIQIQANFVLCMATKQNEKPFWGDFGRWRSTTILPIIERIKYDLAYKKQFALLIGVKEQDLIIALQNHITDLHRQGMSNYWWHSIDVDDFLTK